SVQRSRRLAKIRFDGAWPDSFPDYNVGARCIQIIAVAFVPPGGALMKQQQDKLIVHGNNRVYRRRRRVNQLMLLLSGLAVAFGLVWLFWILATLVMKGGAALT